ncbi:class I SAM-dependent methyltransferase [Methylomagnum sp.]
MENIEIIKAVTALDFDSILDIGSYKGGASVAFALMGKKVISITRGGWWLKKLKPVYDRLFIETYDRSFETFEYDQPFDAIWASHVLEHTRNPGLFLDRCYDSMCPGGTLVLVVPPFKHKVVPGHITPGWNLGILMYNLVEAGFDIKHGHFIVHGYNICAVVKKPLEPRPKNLDWFTKDNVDLWPLPCEPDRGFDGAIESVNWPEEFQQRFSEDMNSLLAVDVDFAADTVQLLRSLWKVA